MTENSRIDLQMGAYELGKEDMLKLSKKICDIMKTMGYKHDIPIIEKDYAGYTDYEISFKNWDKEQEDKDREISSLCEASYQQGYRDGFDVGAQGKTKYEAAMDIHQEELNRIIELTETMRKKMMGLYEKTKEKEKEKNDDK